MKNKEININEISRELGFEPQEGKCIIVKFLPPNLSARLVDFFVGDFYVLQICQDEIILLPFSKITMTMVIELKKEAAFIIDKKEIEAVKIEKDGFNYSIAITTISDTIILTAQQKEMSSFRSSGGLASEFSWTGQPKKNWHVDNLEIVLNDLSKLGVQGV